MSFHLGVMIDEVLDVLRPQQGQVLADGTFGHGGHSIELARRIGRSGTLIALDRDPEMLRIGQARFIAELGGEAPRTIFAAQSYEAINEVLHKENISCGLNGIILDLGINSAQLDDPARGFSFQKDGPLDGRFNPAEGTMTMADILNTFEERELARVFREFGDERLARPIARRVVAERALEPFDRTLRFADLVSSIYPPAQRHGRIHPATRCMMALRIAANDELGGVERGVSACMKALGKHGRLAVLSFHSGEDRIVKQAFRKVGTPRPDPMNLYSATTMEGVEFRQIGKAVKCSAEEADLNPRARSAKLRAIEFTGGEEAES